MNNIQQKFEELVAAVRAEVIEEIQSTLNGGRKNTGRRVPSNHVRLGRARGEKRTPAELARLVSSVLGYVRNNPGQGVEKMARDLGVPSRELVLPIKKLIAGGGIRVVGHKRATKYWPKGKRASR